jgi:hypothetical protein
MACFPLIVPIRPSAPSSVLHRNALRQFELLLLDNFVNQAAMAIYQARNSPTPPGLQRREDELNRLGRAGLLISSVWALKRPWKAPTDGPGGHASHYGAFRWWMKAARPSSPAHAGAP